MAQEFYKPQKGGRRNDEEVGNGVYDPSSFGTAPHSRTESARTQSDRAAGTLGNIDEVLGGEQNTPTGQRDTRPDLRSDAGLMGSGAPDLAAQGRAEQKRAARYASAVPDTDLRDSEEGLFNGKSDDEKGTRRERSASFLKRHRKALLFGIGSSLVTVGPIIVFLIFLLTSLGIPDLAQNVIARELKTTAKASLESTMALEGENEGVDAASDSTFAAINAKFGNLKDQILTKFYGFGPVQSYQAFKAKWTPSGAIANLENSDVIQYGMSAPNVFGRQRLTSITFKTGPNLTDTTTVNVSNPSKFRGIINRIKSPLGTTVDSARQTGEIAAAFQKAMDFGIPDTPWIIRGAATRSYIQKIGGSLGGLLTSKFVGKSSDQAKVEVQKESFDATNDVSGVGTSGSSLDEAEQKVAQTQQQCADDPKCLQQEIATNAGNQATYDRQTAGSVGDYNNSAPDSIGIPAQTEQAAIASTDESTTQRVAEDLANAGSPGVGALFKLCFAYLGSRLDSGMMKAQSNEVQREFLLLVSTAAQQKQGGTSASGLSSALSAMNWKIGAFGNSNPMQPSGSVDTSDTPSTQGNAYGGLSDKTIFDVIFPSSVASVLNPVASSTCSSLTDAKSQLLGAIGLTIVKFVGGLPDAAEAAGGASLGAAAKASVAKFGSSIVDKLTTKKGFGELFQTSKNFARTTAKDGAQTAVATLLFQAAVMSHAGVMHSGLATGQSFANDADNGANQFAQSTLQQQDYAAPLDNTALQQREEDNAQSVSLDNSSRSFVDRYFALSNANSLLSHIVLSVAGKTGRTMAGSFVQSFSHLFNPLRVVGSLFSSLNRKAVAATFSTNSFYGNLQMGITREEYNLIETNLAYAPAENRYTLEQSGKEDAIASKYDTCFTTPITDLIANGDIKRNDNGSINDSGYLCSPQNLGVHNPSYGDLVFRYRLSHMYDNMASTLLDLQQKPSAGAAQ